jgi:hypothetical protein
MRDIVPAVLVLAGATGCVSEYHYEYHPESITSYAQNVTVAPASPPPAATPVAVVASHAHDDRKEPPPADALPAFASTPAPTAHEPARREPAHATYAFQSRPRVEHRLRPAVTATVYSTTAQPVPAFVADDRP